MDKKASPGTEFTAPSARGEQASIVAGLGNASVDAIISKDLDGRVTRWSHAAELLLGYRAAEMLGQPITRIIPPDRQDEEPRILASIARGEEVLNLETERLRKDGTRTAVLLSISPIRDADARIVGATKIARSISEPGQAQMARQRSESLRHSILQALPARIALIDRQGLILMVNDGRAELAHDTMAAPMPALLVGANYLDICRHATAASEETSEQVLAGIGNVLAGRLMHFSIEVPWETPQGRVWTLITVTPQTSDAGGGALITHLDITARKQIEDTLRERNAQLEWLSDLSHRLFLANESLEPLLQSVFAELSTRLGSDAYFHYRPIGPDRLALESAAGLSDPVRAAVAIVPFGELLCGRVASTRAAVIVENLQDSTQSGANLLKRWGAASYAGFPLMAEGTLVGTLAFASRTRTHVHDSELRLIQSVCDQIAMAMARQHARARQQESESRLAAVVNGAVDGIATIDERGTIQSLNGAALALFGYTADEIIGRNVNLLMPEPYRSAHDGHLRRYCQTGEARIIGAGREVEGLRKNGSTFPLDLSVSEVSIDGRRVFVGIVRDISARRNAEAVLRRNELRLRAVTDNASVGLVTLDRNRRYTFVNRAYVRMFDLQQAPEALVGSGPADALSTVYATQISPRLDRAFSGERVAYELTRPAVGGGEPAHYSIVYEPIFDAAGQIAEVVVVTYDLTERKLSEAALQESEARYRHLAGVLPVALYTCDTEGRITYFNDRAAELWGRRPMARESDARYCGAHRLFRPDGRPLAHDQTPMVAAIRDGVSARGVEVIIERADGDRFHVLANVDPLRDERGRIVGAINAFSDISAHKRAEDHLRITQNRLKAALEASQVVLFHQDRQLHYTWIHNPELGYTEQQVVGARDSDLFERAEDAAHTEAIKRSVLETGQTRREEVCIADRGELRYFDLVVQPDRDASGQINGLHCAAIDITLRRRAESVLQSASREKDEFLAMLAHELRNPLAALSAAGALLETRLPQDAALRLPLAMLQRQTQQLTRLVDDLLDVSRIAHGRIELQHEALELGTIIEHAVETVQPLVLEKRHRLELRSASVPLWIRGDHVRLVQVVGNLLHNAVKYTDAGGTITLTTGFDNDRVQLEIRDSGVGIGAEQLPHVFDLFVQSKGTLDRASGGLGIGLSVVKRLVEMHGGTVQAQSAGRGFGATFTMSLPRGHGAVPEAPTAQAAESTVRRRILIVDDNEDAADALAALLELDGHAVHAAYSGRAALSLIDEHEPEIVLLDIGMPGMDGYEVARRIREQHPGSTIRLIALSGYGQEADKVRAISAGFDAYLVKPFVAEQLVRLLGPSEAP
ncbi:MAG: PAS domain S-box protein [Burkholderiaceae bacterium]